MNEAEFEALEREYEREQDKSKLSMPEHPEFKQSDYDDIKRKAGEAFKAGIYTRACIACHQPLFFYPNTYAVGEGHVYSILGEAETHITGMCEFCFDNSTKEPEEH